MATKTEKAPKKPLGTYQKQMRVTIAFAAIVVVLAICAGLAFYFVNLDKTSFEQGGVRYRVEKRDGSYVLVNADGRICEETWDGYYVTDDGMVVVSVLEDGTYSIYAAVEGLEDGEEVFNRVAQTILIFPYVSQQDLQTIEMHNEHGTYTIYRNAAGAFTVKGMESYLATYDSVLFSALTTSTCSMIAQEKLEDPLNDDGAFAEYGIANSETYWYVTTVKDAVYKVILGNKTPSGSGYYVQYVACTDVELDKNGSVISAKETPRDAIYIVSPTVSAPTATAIEALNKPFHEPIETLMNPQIVADSTMSTYYDVQDFVLMHGNDPFIAFEFIDIAARAHTERSAEPFVMLLQEHKGFTLSTDSVLEALRSFYSMAFTRCVKLDPSEEDLVKHGIYVDPVRAYTEKNGDTADIYYVKKDADGSFFLVATSGERCETNADGDFLTACGSVIRVNAETGDSETVTGEGTWSQSYTVPYSVYYTTGKTGSDGKEYEIEQFVNFSVKNENNAYYAYSPYYGMLVEVAGYELEFFNWDLFTWITPKLFEFNVAFMEELRLELPDGTVHSFTLDNTESKQGKASLIKENKFTDKNGTTYLKKKVDGVYGLYKSTGPAYTVSVNAHFRVADKSKESSELFISYFGLPSGGRSEGWFLGKVYRTSSNTLLLCDAENGDLYEIELSSASGNLSVSYNDGERLVDTPIFRKFYESISYASIEQKHVLTDEEEAALIGNKNNFQLRLSVKSADHDLVFEFYYVTARKSYIRISGDGGETFTGDMYILSQRVMKTINDAERLLRGETIDPTAKN